MREFHRNRKRSFGPRDSGRSRDSGFGRSSDRFDRGDSGRRGRDYDQEMHEATCGRCGRKCEVPFRPTSGKPVYCSECFRNKDNSEPRVRPNASNEQLAEINRKLDKIIRALEIKE